MPLKYDSNSKVITGIMIYYSVYVVLCALVEPFSWFGANMLTNLGLLGHAMLMAIPAILAVVFFLYKWYEAKNLKTWQGLKSVSIGDSRIDSFENLRRRAKSHIIITGLGMTNITQYSLKSLYEQSRNVDIDFVMLNPEVLIHNSEYCKSIESFLNIDDVAMKVTSSFEKLKEFCNECNRQQYSHHRASLWVYDTIPTNSATIIDPLSESGEMLIEFYLYQSGTKRPRLHIHKVHQQSSLFDVIYERYSILIKSSKKIV